MRVALAGALYSLFVPLALVSCTGRVGDHVAERSETPAGGKGGQAGGPGSAEGADLATLPSGPRFSRLTHFQWENTVRDLLRLDALPAVAMTLQADAVIGFDNNNAGTALDVSFDLRGDYERAAEAMSSYVAQDPAAVARLLPQSLPQEPEQKARAAIRALAERAYRRPLQDGEEEELLTLFKAGPSLVTNRDAFAAGVEVVLGALLQSPLFLYRIEVGEGRNKQGFALTPSEMASRLSFALTDTMPDDELLEAARSGRLATPEQIEQQAERLLKTSAAAASAAHFHAQLFRLASFEKVEKDPKLFPKFDDQSSGLLKKEAQLFLADIVQAEQPAAAILTSPETFVNNKLAEIYGLSGDFDETFRKVKLDSRRKGMLTQLGFLAANASAKEPDPIHRGVFVSQVILCKDLPSPAANVAPVPVTAGMTNRQRVEAHTGKGTCGAVCHATLINPVGFAFESFDAIGGHRTLDNGSPVDTTGEYGELTEGPISFGDGVELSGRLAKSRDFHECYLRNWLQYLWGRAGQQADEEAVKPLAKESLDGKSVRELLLSFVTSPAFRRYVP